MDAGWLWGMLVGGIGAGVAVDEISGAEVAAGEDVAAGVDEMTASSPLQAAEINNRDPSTATPRKGPNPFHHRPNTWMLISCHGP